MGEGCCDGSSSPNQAGQAQKRQKKTVNGSEISAARSLCSSPSILRPVTFTVTYLKSLTRNKTPMRPSFAAIWIRSLTKPELHSLIDDVKRGDADAISRAIAFVAAESFGIWHNRARAKLCRHFKNYPPSDGERERMVDAIVNRLIDGQFSEQFKDQLSMAIRYDPDRLSDASNVASTSDREYIRRYADWVQHVLDSSSVNPKEGRAPNPVT